ncbi:hypothetical protein SD71_01060 [Cohnella kolymensis]|uniref:CRISPR type III-B/RAMP module-associated protein Cmr5 n=1 Tax=Cohnella kolymensis TaxID=1590652 RepID=A0ABR5A9M6_9BACL|nr:hypothetical protein [Cohnella kolymensis]KIL37315.1 hypothetical protein SD71_01060 [Cohnella kolymensis]
MFERDYDLKGKHASYVKYLVNNAKVFKRYIDVYMVGSVMGILHGRKATKDSSVSDEASIFAGAFNTERLKCEFLYRLIMLLDETPGLTEEQRVDRAFRVDDSMPDALKENMDLFHSYVFGGIEVLYEKYEDCTTTDDI